MNEIQLLLSTLPKKSTSTIAGHVIDWRISLLSRFQTIPADMTTQNDRPSTQDIYTCFEPENHLRSEHAHLESEHAHLESEHTHLESEHAHLDTVHTNLESKHNHLEPDQTLLDIVYTHLESAPTHLKSGHTYLEWLVFSIQWRVSQHHLQGFCIAISEFEE